LKKARQANDVGELLEPQELLDVGLKRVRGGESLKLKLVEKGLCL